MFTNINPEPCRYTLVKIIQGSLRIHNLEDIVRILQRLMYVNYFILYYKEIYFGLRSVIFDYIYCVTIIII